MKTLDELLIDFPADWDVQVAVCCRGETHNGPPGVRRWTATAVPKMTTPAQILAGARPDMRRIQSDCSGTPREAVLDVIDRIAAGPPVDDGRGA